MIQGHSNKQPYCKKNLLDRSILAQVVGQFHVLVELVAEAVIKPEDLDQSFTNGQLVLVKVKATEKTIDHLPALLITCKSV